MKPGHKMWKELLYDCLSKWTTKTILIHYIFVLKELLLNEKPKGLGPMHNKYTST